jgi:hypothetical protein
VSEFSNRNRRVVAERVGWPDGAVEECERLERQHPGYSVSWRDEDRTGPATFHQERGFHGWRTGDDPGYMTYGPAGEQHYVHRPEWYGETADELDAKLP